MRRRASASAKAAHITPSATRHTATIPPPAPPDALMISGCVLARRIAATAPPRPMPMWPSSRRGSDASARRMATPTTVADEAGARVGEVDREPDRGNEGHRQAAPDRRGAVGGPGEREDQRHHAPGAHRVPVAERVAEPALDLDRRGGAGEGGGVDSARDREDRDGDRGRRQAPGRRAPVVAMEGREGEEPDAGVPDEARDLVEGQLDARGPEQARAGPGEQKPSASTGPRMVRGAERAAGKRQRRRRRKNPPDDEARDSWATMS